MLVDVVLRDRAILKPPHEDLLKHTTHCFSAEEVMTFLGRELNRSLKEELLNDDKKWWP